MAPPNSARPALTTWLADEFDAMAGLDEASPPLTFGLLKEKDIELAMLTTDLSSGTQNELPFQNRARAFKPQVWAFNSSVPKVFDADRRSPRCPRPRCVPRRSLPTILE